MLKQQIEEVLDKSVRPFLHSHGGEVRLVDYEDGVVVVTLSGACSGCPSADLSTRCFIEDQLKEHLPQVRRVELDRVTDPELLAFARKILKGEA